MIGATRLARPGIHIMLRPFHFLALAVIVSVNAPAAQSAEHYEVRTVDVGAEGDESALDAYYRDALIPALRRAGTGPVGVLEPVDADDHRLFVVITHDQPDGPTRVKNALAVDEDYQSAAADYLGQKPKEAPFKRISSELLVAMDCWPQVAPPEHEIEDRVYELRLYESPHEGIGELKVEMFNNGEVPIFLDCGIEPVWMGQAVIGPLMPSLTYLTVYPNDEARQAAWKNFVAHPDWKVLKAEPKYAGTVNRIDKYVLKAKPYSQILILRRSPLVSRDP